MLPAAEVCRRRWRLTVLTFGSNSRPREERGLFVFAHGESPRRLACVYNRDLWLRLGPGLSARRADSTAGAARRNLIMSFTALCRVLCGGVFIGRPRDRLPRCRDSKGTAAGAPQAPPPDRGQTSDARAETGRAGLRIHRDRPLAAVDHGPAGGRWAGDEDLREVGRPGPRRRAARADQRRQTAGDRPQHGSQPCRHRGGRPVLAPAGQAARVAGRRRARSAGRSSTRRRIRCAPRRPGWPASTRRCGKAGSSCSTTASTRRRPASSATSRSGPATA